MNTITADHDVSRVGRAILYEDLDNISRVIDPNNLLSMARVDLGFVLEMIVEQLNHSLPGKQANTVTEPRRIV